MKLTPALRDHVRHRFLDSLPNHYDRDSCDLRVELEHGTGEHKRRYEEVHAQLTVPGRMLVARARAKDIYIAVDEAQRQLLRNLDDWRSRALETARFPKKYYAARLVEEGRLPALLPDGPAVQPDERARAHESGSSPTPLRPAPEVPENEEPTGEPAPRVEPLLLAERSAPPPAPAPWRPAPSLLETMEARRTVRRFGDRPLADGVVAALAEALHCAPSAGNLESRRFWFVRDGAARDALAEASHDQRFVGAAPLVIVCCAHLASASIHGRRGVDLYAPMDVAVAIENLLLAATAMGLGAAWIGDFDEEGVRRVLGIPSEIRPLALVPVGQAAESPARPQRLPLGELVRYV